jgi:hypothetical protein
MNIKTALSSPKALFTRLHMNHIHEAFTMDISIAEEMLTVQYSTRLYKQQQQKESGCQQTIPSKLELLDHVW